MNIYLAVALFSLIILIYWIITELFTVLFRLVGLPEEKARFQVISLLTGCGFTTHESEMFISTKPRRRLARTIMLFGYVFNITIITTLINVFMSKTSSHAQTFLALLLPIAIVAMIIILMRVPFIRSKIDRLLIRLAGRMLNRGDANTVMVIDYIDKDAIAQVYLKNVPVSLAGKTLAQMGLRGESNILVMLIEHKGKSAQPAMADTVFLSGDTLTVFGNYKNICRVFEANEQLGE